MQKHTAALMAVTLMTLWGCSGQDAPGPQEPVVPVTDVQIVPDTPAALQLGFSEDELAADPSQRIDPGETAVVFLETPGTSDPGGDTGTAGSDLIPLRLPGDGTYTLDVQTDLQSVRLLDSQGAVVLQSGGSAGLPAGNYALELTAKPGTAESVLWVTHQLGRITVTTDPTDVDSSQIKFKNRTFNSANFQKSNLAAATIENCTFNKCNFFHANLQSALVTNTTFNDSGMQGLMANFLMASGLKLFRTTTDGSVWNQAVLPGTHFEGATGTAVDFSQTDLQGATFTNNGFSLSNFEGANLTDANLNADGTGNNFVESNFTNATITGANFEGVALGGATWVDGQTLPQDQVGPPK